MEKQIRQEGCAACKLADKCHIAEANEKSGLAALLAFGIPLVLMLAALLIVKLLGQSEGIAALSMLVLLAVYYFILWLQRRRIAKCMAYHVEEQ